MLHLNIRLCNLTRIKKLEYINLNKLKFLSTISDINVHSKLIIKQNQLYLHGVIPNQTSKFDPRCYIFESIQGDLKNVIENKYLPSDLPFGFKFLEAIHRPKEGGIIVKYEYKAQNDKSNIEEEEIIKSIKSHLKEINKGKLFSLLSAKVYPIKGVPFNEDLFLQYPTGTLKVDMQGPDVQVEKLFDSFRPFGRISSITFHPPEAAGFPRYAIIKYFGPSAASAARVCLHGLVFDGTRIAINYKSRNFFKPIWTWFLSHPKFTVPFLLGTFLGLLYSIFEPLRVFYIKNKISGRFNVGNYEYLKWIKFDSIKKALLSKFSSQHRAEFPVWTGSKENLEFLEENLAKSPETMILIHGPKGSEKEILVNMAVKNRKNVLKVKCSNFIKPHTSGNLSSLAKEFGYFPVFDFLNQMVELIDNVMSATIGKPANFGSSKEKQKESILACTMKALSELQANPSQKNDDDSTEPKDAPIVIFYDFLDKSTSEDPFWKQLTDWSSDLVNSHIADVIFISDNPSAQRVLSNWVSLSNFSFLGLSDANLDDAMEIVQNRLITYLPYNLRNSIKPLGGRMSDLNTFIQKVHSGQQPEEAIEDIIHSSTAEISKVLFGSLKGTRSSIVSPLISWIIIKELSMNGYVGYDYIKNNKYFDGTDEDLQILEKAEIITIDHDDDEPSVILPGRPIYLKAFEKLVKDEHLNATIQNQLHKKQIEKYTTKIQQIEEEMLKLASIKIDTDYSWFSYLSPTHWFSSKTCGSPQTIRERMTYLLSKLKALQKDLRTSERTLKDAQKILNTTPVIADLGK